MLKETYHIRINEKEMMPILRVGPADTGPLLVIVPSIFGIGTDVVDYALAFASEGALVYVLDPFWRKAPSKLTRKRFV